MKNIFYNVIKTENQFSQLIVNMLNAEEDIKKIIQKFLFPNEENELDSVHTQLRFEEGQPDIIFKLKNGEEVIVEVKTQDSTLTFNQPEGYVPLLSKNNNKYLFFLIPKYYKHKSEIEERFEKIEKKEGVCLKILYWNALINNLKKLDIKSDLIYELINHLDEKFGYDNINFKPDEIKYMETNDIPDKVLKLNEAVNSLAKSFAYKDLIWDNKIDAGYGDGYGFWYKNSIWFGYWFELWSEEKASLIIMVNQNVVDEVKFNSFETFFKKHGKREIKTYRSIYKFINVLDLDTEKIKNMVDDFVNHGI
ncbi:MAG TPA: hypothetical protein VFI29_04705 [Hanamia sp.]|nr:hypothetical protein [Hanamia sp.]